MISIEGLKGVTPRAKVKLIIERTNGAKEVVDVLARIDTQDELDYYANGGILQYVLRRLAA